MYTNILVPTDGSAAAESAAHHAVALAKRADSEAMVHAVNVLDTRAYEAAAEDEVPVSAEFETAEREAESAVEYVADLGAQADQPVTTSVENGVPPEAILRYANESACDLIVMGTHGWTEFSRMVTGSVTEKVIRATDLPVLTTHASEMEPDAGPHYDRILTPTDGSTGAGVALDHALDIGRAFESTVHSLSVADPSSLTGNYDGGFEAGHVMGYLESSAKQYVETAQTEGKTKGVEVHGHVDSGSPFRKICEFADQHDIDLIVMGTHGRTGLARVLLGSVTERVIRRSAVPVLVVRSVSDAV